MLFEDDPVAIAQNDLAGLIGIGQPARFGHSVLAAGKIGSWFAFAFLRYHPAIFPRLNPIDVPSKHDASPVGSFASPTPIARLSRRCRYVFFTCTDRITPSRIEPPLCRPLQEAPFNN